MFMLIYTSTDLHFLYFSLILEALFIKSLIKGFQREWYGSVNSLLLILMVSNGHFTLYIREEAAFEKTCIKLLILIDK